MTLLPLRPSISERSTVVLPAPISPVMTMKPSPWYSPYYLDIGTGSSNLTWQGLFGIAYAFKWGDVVFAYRNLYYDQSNDELLQNFRFSGPALGATFRF